MPDLGSRFWREGDWLSGLMRKPEHAKWFGGNAYVYSEIQARTMVHEAYKRGLEEGRGERASSTEARDDE